MHLQILGSSNMIGRKRYEAKENETPCSPKFEVISRQTSDINLKSDL